MSDSPSSCNQFPGQRRSILHAPSVQSDRVFIKTAGNALQAIPRAQLEQQDLIAVTVPGVSKPGDDILVAAPDDGRLIRATIPDRACAGQTFFVHVPPPQVAAMGIPINMNPAVLGNGSGGTQVVTGEDVEQDDLTLAEVAGGAAEKSSPLVSNANTTQQLSHQDSNLILVQVPPGTMPGSKMHVKVPDGRTIEAQVPTDPNVREFYLRIPPKPQNWHDSPLAVASAAATPYFV